jgi:hypothetical protein
VYWRYFRHQITHKAMITPKVQKMIIPLSLPIMRDSSAHQPVRATK